MIKQCIGTIHALLFTSPTFTCGVKESVVLVKTTKPFSILTVKCSTGDKDTRLWGSNGVRGVGGTSATFMWKKERRGRMSWEGG